MTIQISYEINGNKYTYNTFDKIINLPNYDKIRYIECYNMDIVELPVLPKSLIYLNCVHNTKMTKLPELPKSLTKLCCAYNNLTELPELPDNLTVLLCQNNCINILPKLPQTIKLIRCSYNCANWIFKYICYENINEYNKWLDNHHKLFIQKIELWFLECKYNPKYKYCQKRLKLEFDELYSKIT